MGMIVGITVMVIYAIIANYYSYRVLKRRIINKKKRWNLNICSGKTDCGGINADIVKHTECKNFVLIDDIYNLPFKDDEFETVISSHTIEHVEDPQKFFDELKRVGKEVTLIVPPLWDISAAFNIFEHRWVFLALKKEHIGELPPHIPLIFSELIHKVFGQKIRA